MNYFLTPTSNNANEVFVSSNMIETSNHISYLHPSSMVTSNERVRENHFTLARVISFPLRIY